ncbi:hypothetical protein [Winogradskyella sp. 3972H.M.0a.05]|uniref:hypothetical protein n=1 Tax=Winogradskyella sp. 3972H.M.0a.05 TaxID=2950277 RepID=UPI0033924C26
MKETSVDLYKSLEPGFVVVVTATIKEDGSLIIDDFDGSKGANETFGSDVETSITISTEDVDRLITKLNKKTNFSLNPLKLLTKTPNEQFEIKDRHDLLVWIQQEYSHIEAKSKLEALFKSYGISPKRNSWPFG